MGVDQLAQRNAHGFFNGAGPFDVAGDAEQFGAGVVRPADARKPVPAATQDCRHNRDGFDVVDGGGTAVDADVCRKRRLQPRHAFLAFEAFKKRRLFAANVGARAVMDVTLEIPAVDIVLADQLRFLGLIDRGLQALALADEFAADIDVANMRPHRERRDETTLDEQMRVVAHDVPVLARAGLGFVGIDDEIVRPFFYFLRHKGPLQAGRKTCAAAAA